MNMIRFFINNYEEGKWGPRDWDKYVNNLIKKEYVIDYIRSHYGNYPMVICYLTKRDYYIIDIYPFGLDSIEFNRYYISDYEINISDSIWIDKKILTRQVLLDKILEQI